MILSLATEADVDAVLAANAPRAGLRKEIRVTLDHDVADISPCADDVTSFVVATGTVRHVYVHAAA